MLRRRDLLRLGALAPIGLTLPTLLARDPARKVRVRSCILVFMEGGPSHIDLWDMKPDAPAEVRGEFQPIQTRTPGITVCEHMPMLARQWHRFAQVRSVHHTVTDHNAGSYYALTGHSPFEGTRLVVADSPRNFPPFGAVLAKLRPSGGPLPDFVHVAEIMSNLGYDIPGQSAGFLGAAFDPFRTGDPSLPDYRVPGLSPRDDVPMERLRQRTDLLEELDRSPSPERMSVFQKKAVALIGSPEVRRAFDLSDEPARVRDRYGLDPGTDRDIEARKFGGMPHLGQSMLLTRRLIEAGVRLVTLVTGRRIDQAWDTHRDHFPLLKRSLLPMFDRSFSALLEDLSERGLLDETLIVVMGEFGRTPKLGYVTSNAGAAKNGRDHWPFCYTVFFGGAGVPEGAIVGASDKQAAFPARDPATPADVAATVYELMGVSSETEIRDAQNQPHPISRGRPIAALTE